MSEESTAAPSTRIVLIRHGESVATYERFLAGHRSCKGITDLGRRQAEALRDRLTRTHELAVDVLVSSHVLRAVQTAEIIAPALGELPMVIDPGVGEHDPGPVCDGLTFAEFIARFGDARDWEEPYREYFPGGETVADFHYRVARSLHALVAAHAGRCVLVVCHGGVVDVAFRTFLNTPITGNFELHAVNAAITEFELLRPRRWKLSRYNDAAHLDGLPVSTAGMPAV